MAIKVKKVANNGENTGQQILSPRVVINYGEDENRMANGITWKMLKKAMAEQRI